MRAIVLAALAIMVTVGCGPQRIERPLEGAPVGESARATVEAGTESGPPPTLAPARSVSPGGPPPTLAPARSVSPGASPSPGAVALASPSPAPVPTHVIVATDGQGANMRTGPSTSASVITTLREGTLVAVIGAPVTVDGRAWQEIQSGNQRGWVVAVVVRAR